MRGNVFSPRRGFVTLFTLINGLLFLSASAFAQHTYYISKSSGSDSNSSTQARSKTTPWAHLPGMPSCSASCASYSPVAGDSFILKGGDTWVASDLGVFWQWSGTSSSQIYVGVDQTWYSGSAWSRPIWTCGGAACSYTSNGNAFFTMGSSVDYLTVDNIEVTGLYQSTGGYPNFFSIYGSYDTFEHIYAHGWSHASAASGAQDNSAVFSSSTCCGGGIGNIVHDNVIDGSDTAGDSMVCFYAGVDTAYNNICRNVTNGFEGSGNNIHDNWFGPINMCFVTGGCHQNNLFQFGPVGSATSVFIYNNLITGTTASGGITKLWLSGNNSNNATGYAFNNVIYNNASGNMVNLAGHNAVNYGTWYFFNNTVECGTDSNPASGSGGCGNDSGGSSGMTFVLHSKNNHWITNASPPLSCVHSSCDFTDDVTQTVAAASAQGYSSGSTYAFAPTSGTGATIGTGTNNQSICTTITGLNASAGAACQNATGYACSYNTSNHTVSCPAETPLVPRPSTTAWNVGAYQYAGGTQTTVTPPTSLAAAAH
jgi:hypothetical protein